MTVVIKAVKICIMVFVYPVFYWVDRYVVPVSNVFWHSYMQDLFIPCLYLLNGGIILELLKITREGRKKALYVYGGAMFLFGVQMEIVQGSKGDFNDILCYAASITTGIFIWFLLLDREVRSVY